MHDSEKIVFSPESYFFNSDELQLKNLLGYFFEIFSQANYLVGLYNKDSKLTPAPSIHISPYWRCFSNAQSQNLIYKHIAPALLTPYHKKKRHLGPV